MMSRAFHTDDDSPPGHAEARVKTPAYTGLQPQMRPVTGAFKPPGQEPFNTRRRAEERANSRRTVDLGSDDEDPGRADGDTATRAHAKEELVPVGTTERGRIVDRTDVEADLTRIGKAADIARGKQPQHPAG